MKGDHTMTGPSRLVARAAAAGRLHHAYLLTGADSAARREEALAISSFLLCSKTLPEGRAEWPCGECLDCVRFQRGVNPDLLEVHPKGKSLGIEEIRAVQEQLNFAPLNGRARVVLLPEAHTMTPEAANAFLKTLEEPPRGNFILLCAPSASSLLDTIVSRCQELRMPPGGKAARGPGLQPVEGPEDGLPLPVRRATVSLVLNGVQGQVEAFSTHLFPLVRHLAKDTATLSAAIAFLQSIVRDLYLVASGLLGPESNAECLENSDLSRPLFELARWVNYDSLSAWQDELLRAESMQERNVNRELLVMRLLLYWLDLPIS